MINDFVILKNKNILEALKKIDDNKHGFVVVIDIHNKVIGVLTDGDIRRLILNDISMYKEVGEVCNKNYKYINVHKNFTDLINIFKDTKVKFVPIVDEQKQFLNIITRNNMHALLLHNMQPDLKYDFCSIDDSIIDYEIYKRPWGFYKTIVLNDMFQSKLISVNPHGQLSLQIHKKREEHWIIVHGHGKVVLDESTLMVSEGNVIFVPKGCKHRLINTSNEDNLILIEIQRGTYFGEDDIIRIEDFYGRE